LTMLMLVSCETVAVYRPRGSVHQRGNGPPAHAKAHGYHRKHIDGLELVYDSTYGVYAVLGKPDHYYSDGYYYRMYGGIWEVSLRIDSNWAPTTVVSLPPGLKTKTGIKVKSQNAKAVASAKNHKFKRK
jgi:hypothetical protein